MADVAPQVRQAMATHPGFADVGQRMLLAWAEGVLGLRDERAYGMGVAELGVGYEALEKPPKLKGGMIKVGLSPLLGKR